MEGGGLRKGDGKDEVATRGRREDERVGGEGEGEGKRGRDRE